jgi:hypothetical protein
MRSSSGGGSSLSRSFSRESRPTFNMGGGSDVSRSFRRGGGESLSRSLGNTGQGASNRNSSALRSYRPNPSGSLGGISSSGGASRDRSSLGQSMRRMQSGRGSSGDNAAAGIRSQFSRPRPNSESAANQSALVESLRNSRRRGGSEARSGQLGGDSLTARSNRFDRFDGNRAGDNPGNANRSILSQQLGDSNGARISRRDQRGMNSFRRTPTNDQVRNFLNMNNRRGENSRRGNNLGLPDGNGENRLGRSGENVGDQNRRGGFNRLGEQNRDGTIARGDGERGQNWRERLNRNGDGTPGSDNLVRIGRERGNARDVDFNRRNGDFTRGDGNRNWGDGDGNGRRWRGGELGKGDHRDWSGGWRDGKRFDVAHKIRDHWRDRDWDHDHDVPFHGNWWKHHGHHGHHRHHHHHHWGHDWWDHWGWFASFHHRPYYWWNWCSAPVLRTWFTFDWATPYYWDYGPGEYIHCDNNVIYVNGQWFAPSPVYYEQTVQLAESTPPIAPAQAAQIEWLPLGVFAISRDGVVDNNLLVQLAVTKEGVISGTVLNQVTGVTFDIAGSVDKQTQRAAWTYVDEAGKKVAMETSVFNLTQPESTALLQNGPADMQVVELVRLEQPKAEADAAAGAAEAAVAKPQAVDALKGEAAAEPLPLPLPPQGE